MCDPTRKNWSSLSIWMQVGLNENLYVTCKLNKIINEHLIRMIISISFANIDKTKYSSLS